MADADIHVELDGAFQGTDYDIVTAVDGAVDTTYQARGAEAVLIDASAAPVTVTLPEPFEAARTLVKKTDGSANAVTIATPTDETIDGQADLSITGQWQTRELLCDGTNYYII